MEKEAGMEGSPIGGLAFSFLRPPALLHIYWGLHAIHLVLAAIALWAWWRLRRIEEGERRKKDQGAVRDTIDAQSSLLPAPLSLLLKTAPWLCLGLLFWIPGIYLEWPSDPWEHLRRINEWHAHGTVTAHSAWKKSTYFLPYSLTGHTTGLTQLSWLNFYYTAACLLLSWQYYRLARAVGLGERASMIFVILQALLMGNNVFSFYRYYGLSSTIFAQLGAVALTRIVLECLSCPRITRDNTKKEFHGQLSTEHPAKQDLIQLIPATLALLVLIAFNHIQGLGIAGLGILAVIAWRLIEWKRSMLGWLAGAAALLSVAIVLWFPRHAALNEVYRPQGWLTACYGFNFFSLSSPAFERLSHILGAFGAINLFLSLWLIVRKNHVAGWLTLTPIIVLILPCFALPFAHLLAATTSAENIVTFHRMLLAVPAGLALVAALDALLSTRAIAASRGAPLSRYSPMLLLTTGLPLVLGLSPASPSYNRSWHSLQRTPDDLQLRHLVAPWTPRTIAQPTDEHTLMISTALGSEVYESFVLTFSLSAFRDIHAPLDSTKINRQLGWLQNPHAHEPSALVDFSSANAFWITLTGAPYQHEVRDGVQTISNLPGNTTDAFSSELIPVSPGQRYRLTSSIRQIRGAPAANYLAVAWYDREKRFMAAAIPEPEGADSPVGWSNGTYSYYGLVGQSASTEWIQHTVTFGARTSAAIPAHAAFIRVGALLNYDAVPEAQVQLAKIQLQTGLVQQQLIWLPCPERLYSFGSLVGYLSGHWPTQRVAVDHAGTVELRRYVFLQPAASFPVHRAFPPAD